MKGVYKMAKNRSSFGAVNNLFQTKETTKQEEHDVQHVQRDINAQEVHEVQENNSYLKKDTLKGTQGKKGYKLPRINMAFTPENHKYITFESRRRGLSATEFVNKIISEYKDRVGE